jgi:thiol-disulfide isomerase/thioredoxin
MRQQQEAGMTSCSRNKSSQNFSVGATVLLRRFLVGSWILLSATVTAAFQQPALRMVKPSTATGSLSYSSLVDPPLDSSTAETSRSFVERMRATVLQQQHKQQSSSVSSTSRIPEITTLQEFHSVIQQNSQQRKVTFVQWYAPWCRACKKLQPVLDRLHRDEADAVSCVAVPSHKAADNLHVGFGIQTVPYGHIYHPTAGLVEELKLHPRTYHSTFARILQSYVDGYCTLADDVDATTGTYAAPYERVS